MAIVQRSVEIKASPQETMSLLSDAGRWPDWYPGMSEVDITAPFPEAGGKVAFKVKSAGLSLPITETVLDYQPDKLQLFQMEGMLSGRARWELTPEGDGTRLTTTFDYTLPGGVLGKIADALIARRLNAKSLQEGLRNFKELVERQ
jgi:carbon monoxide dehydrogenase subunit G